MEVIIFYTLDFKDMSSMIVNLLWDILPNIMSLTIFWCCWRCWHCTENVIEFISNFLLNGFLFKIYAETKMGEMFSIFCLVCEQKLWQSFRWECRPFIPCIGRLRLSNKNKDHLEFTHLLHTYKRKKNLFWTYSKFWT